MQASSIQSTRKASRGRPRHQYERPILQPIATSAMLEEKSGSAQSMTDAASASEEYVPSGESVSPDTLARHEVRLGGTVAPVEDSSPPSKKKSKLTGLQLRNILRDETWHSLGEVELLDLPVWFENQVCQFNIG